MSFLPRFPPDSPLLIVDGITNPSQKIHTQKTIMFDWLSPVLDYNGMGIFHFYRTNIYVIEHNQIGTNQFSTHNPCFSQFFKFYIKLIGDIFVNNYNC